MCRVRDALDQRVPEVREEEEDHQAKDPVLAGVEVVLEAGVFGHLLRKKQHAEKKQ
jgi:hypothetical protein